MFWTTRTGRIIALSEMTDSHLRNAISLMARLGWKEKLAVLHAELARRKTGEVEPMISIRTPTSARTEIAEEIIKTQGRMHPTEFPTVFMRIVTAKSPKRIITTLSTVRIEPTGGRNRNYHPPERHNKYSDVERVLEDTSHTRVTKQMIADQHQRWIDNWDTYKADARAHYKRKEIQRNRRRELVVDYGATGHLTDAMTYQVGTSSWGWPVVATVHDEVRVTVPESSAPEERRWPLPVFAPNAEVPTAQEITRAAGRLQGSNEVLISYMNAVQEMMRNQVLPPLMGRVTVNTATGEETITELSPQEVANGLDIIARRNT
jgi:hypothetical protein